MAKRARFFRQPSLTGTTDEAIRAHLCMDPVEGTGAFTGNVRVADKAELFANYGGQSQFQKIARQITAAGVYPDKGTGALTAAATAGLSTLKLAANVFQSEHATLTADVPGLLVLITGGSTAVGEARLIDSWGASQTATVNRAWQSGRVPANSDPYEILIDTRWLETLRIKSEFESSSSTATATIRIALFDWPLTLAPTEAYRASRGSYDTEQTINATGISRIVEETAYYQGEEVTLNVKGSFGVQIDVRAISTGKLSLWAAVK